MKLSISLQEEDVGFLDAYARSQGIKSRSGVVIRERDHGEAIRGWSEIHDQEFPRQRGRHAA